MKNEASRFVIVDPSLRDERGHHFTLSKHIALSADMAGFDPVWLCHRGASFIAPEFVTVEATFSLSMYDAYMRAGERAGPKSVFGKLEQSTRMFLDRLSRTKSKTAPADALFASQLDQAIRRLDLGPSDRLLFHTADGMTFAAIDRLYCMHDQAELPILHVCTPYDPVSVMPNPVAERPVMDCVDRWRRLGIIGSRLFLYGENERLAGHLSSLWATKVGALPLPAVSSAAAGEIETANPWPDDRASSALKIVHLGPARQEKGFDLLPDIVAETISNLKSALPRAEVPPVCFAIQCTPQIIGYTPPILATIEKLRRFPDDLVILLEQTLSDAEYSTLAKSCDVFLLPYGQREYAFRSSGIVTEALASGKILVTTGETYPASMIAPGAGAVAKTPGQFGKALADICQNREDYLAAAKEAGARYRETYSVDSYVPRCLAAESVSA